MAALRGIPLSEVLRANMKNIQAVYDIKMKVEQCKKEINGNSVDWLSESSKDEDRQAALPIWLGGSDDSSDSPDESYDDEQSHALPSAGEESRTLGKITGTSQHAYCDVKQATSDFSSPTSSSASRVTETMLEAEAVVKGEYLSLHQGPQVELLGVDKFRELVSSYGTLASIICSFLNGREGGELYAGVRKSGEVVGVALTRKQRDDVRQVVDRVVSQMIVPRLPTMLVEGRPLVVSGCCF